jgi:hypothetical protein
LAIGKKGWLTGKRAQFFLVLLVFMIIIIVGLAYYSVESSTLERETTGVPEKGSSMLSQVRTELRRSLEEKPYTNTSVEEHLTQFQVEAQRSGFDLQTQCREATSSSYPSVYPTFTLDCNLSISWEDNEVSSSIAHAYTVPFKVTAFSDASRSTGANVFNINSTVYYRITGWDGNTVNFTVTEEGEQKYSVLHVLENYYAEGNFTVDEGGVWTLRITDEDAGDTYTTYIYVPERRIEIILKGEGSDWLPRRHFVRGERMKVLAIVKDVRGNPLPVPVRVSIKKTEGITEKYGDEGTADSDGNYDTEFDLKSYEDPGNFTVTVTEQQYYSSNSTTMQILETSYDRYIKLEPDRMNYNQPAAEAFTTGCGYSAWFNTPLNTYPTPEDPGLDFRVVALTGDNVYNVLRVNARSRIVFTPQVHANQVHLIMSKCEQCPSTYSANPA